MYNLSTGIDFSVSFSPLDLTMAREELGLSMRELAEKLGLSVAAISRWESSNREMTYSEILRWALIRLKEIRNQEEWEERINERGGTQGHTEADGIEGGNDGKNFGSVIANISPMGEREGENPDSHNVASGVGGYRSPCPNNGNLYTRADDSQKTGASEKEMSNQCCVVAVFNQAGGVGKTTLTRDVGYELSSRGFKVLLVDADPQGTLGTFFGFSPGETPREQLFWSNICERNNQKPPSRVRTEFGLDVGLANRQLLTDEMFLMQQRDMARVAAVMGRLRKEYDWILIDCPPKMAEISYQILLAVDGLLVPVQTEPKAVVSFVETQLEIVDANGRRANMGLPPLRVYGVIPTIHNPRLLLHQHEHKALRDEVCPEFGYQLYPAIPRFIAVSEAGLLKRPLKDYDDRCPVNAVVAEITDRLLKEVR